MYKLPELVRKPRATAAMIAAAIALISASGASSASAAESQSSKTVRVEASRLGKEVLSLWRKAPRSEQVHASIFEALPPGEAYDIKNWTDRRLLVKVTKPDPKTAKPMVYSFGAQMGLSKDGKLAPETTSYVSVQKQTAKQAADQDDFAGQYVDLKKDDLHSPSKGWMAESETALTGRAATFEFTDTFNVIYGDSDKPFNTTLFDVIRTRAANIIAAAQPEK